MRTFLAVQLPLPIRNQLAALEPAFSDHARALKWVPPALLHITVRFLGEVEDSRLTGVCEAASVAAGHVPPFSLEMAGIGAFPHDRAPRVVWAGLASDQGLANLTRLFAALEEALAAQGFARDKRGLSPHITLARVRDQATPLERRTLGDTVRRLQQHAHIAGSFAVSALHVMKSELSPAGPRYTSMAEAALGSGTLSTDQRQHEEA